jgi:hypothetical protein
VATNLFKSRLSADDEDLIHTTTHTRLQHMHYFSISVSSYSIIICFYNYCNLVDLTRTYFNISIVRRMASATTDDTHAKSMAHQRHDMFNMLTLPMVVIVNICTIRAFFFGGPNIDEAALDSAWKWQIATLNTYIFIDTLYISFVPSCVAAPTTILIHHVVVFLGWLAVPHQYAQCRPIATCLLSCEINTLFMIARKFVPFQKHPSIMTLVRCGFYLTWVPLRLVIFPYCCYLGYFLAEIFYKENGTLVNIGSLGFVLLLLMTGLNVKWSYDLLLANMKKTKASV